MTADMLAHTRAVLAARHKAARQQHARWDRELATARRNSDWGRERLAQRYKLRNEGVAEELERVADDLGFDLRRDHK